MKIGRLGTDKSRHVLDITPTEQALILDALRDFLQDRSDTYSFDCGHDPIVVSQMIRALEQDEAGVPA